MSTAGTPQQPRSAWAWRSWWPLWLAQAAVLLLAVWARLARQRWVFVGDAVLPTDGDSAYHLRRMLETVKASSYPALFDPLTNWPHGAVSMWSPGWDWLGAGFIQLLGAGHERALAERLAAALPVLFGAALVVVVMVVANRFSKRGRPYVGVAAGLFIALIPHAMAMTELGRMDHHAPEVLAVALLTGWTVLVCDRPAGSLRRGAWLELGGALVIAVSSWIAPVVVVYVGIATVALAVSALTRPGELARGSWLGSGALALAAAALLLALAFRPVVAAHGHAFSYFFPSYFQPVLLLLGAVVVACAAFSGRWLPDVAVSASSVAKRAALAAVAATIVGGVILLLLPQAREALTGGVAEYLATREPWLARIDELQPLSWSSYDAMFGVSAWLAPLLLPVGLWAAYRAGRRRAVVLGLWTVTLLLLSLAQNRWSRGLTVHVAVGLALGLHAVLRRLLAASAASRLAPATGARIERGLLLLSALILLLFRDPELLMRPPVDSPRVAIESAALFLRGRALESRQPAGVLVRWDYGQQVLAIARLPILSGGFGPFSGRDGFEAERDAWYGSQHELATMMKRRRVRWVIAGTATFQNVKVPEAGAPFANGAINPAYFQALPLAPLMLGGSALPELGVPHLDHLCPRFAGPELSGPLPTLWVFERVAGALLEGRAPPSSRVVAELPLKHSGGRALYLAYADADREGRFRLRMPTPTGVRTPSLQTATQARVHRRGVAPAALQVPEGAVRFGAVLLVPDPPESR